MHILIDLVAVACSGKLRRRISLGDSCLEIARLGEIGPHVHQCFTLTVWVQTEHFEARMAANIMGHILVPWC
jgi:hypothetical protein